MAGDVQLLNMVAGNDVVPNGSAAFGGVTERHDGLLGLLDDSDLQQVDVVMEVVKDDEGGVDVVVGESFE